MAKNKLIVNYKYDFELYGLISTEKGYRLAWLINQYLNIHLVKEKDIVLDFVKSDEIAISNYFYQTENTLFRLLKNKSENKNTDRMAYLLPELSNFDFLILKKGAIDGRHDQGFITNLKKIKELQYITKLNFESLKSKENLIF